MTTESTTEIKCSCGQMFFPKVKHGIIQLRCYRCSLKLLQGHPAPNHPSLRRFTPKPDLKLVKD